MLILLPPSESKIATPRRGRPVDLEALSFPELTPVRTRVLRALATTSARRDALPRLLVGDSMAAEVERNRHLSDIPARPALGVYTGPMFSELGPGSLSAAAKRRAARWVVVVSSLWGALRPTDRIPPYRLNICADLVGVGALEPLWRPALGPVLADAAGRRGLIVDLRSPNFRAVGRPPGLGARTVTVRVLRADGTRGASAHASKRTRGAVVRHLLESGANPRSPEDLSTTLAAAWTTRVTRPEVQGQPWTLDVAAAE